MSFLLGAKTLILGRVGRYVLMILGAVIIYQIVIGEAKRSAVANYVLKQIEIQNERIKSADRVRNSIKPLTGKLHGRHCRDCPK